MNPHNRFYEEKQIPSLGKRLLLIIVFLMLVGVSSFIAWRYFKAIAPLEGEIPLIMADQTPYKIKPISSGAPIIPHQDKLVYERLGKNIREDAKVERLLPLPEEPLALSSPPELNTPQDPLPESAPFLTVVPETSTPERSIASLDDLIDLTEKDSTIIPPSPPPTLQAKEGLYRIQLGSLPSQEKAEQEWKRLSHQNDTLRSLKPRIQKIDLGGEKGLVYRLLVEGLPSRTASKSLCDQLSQKKASCLVLQP